MGAPHDQPKLRSEDEMEQASEQTLSLSDSGQHEKQDAGQEDMPQGFVQTDEQPAKLRQQTRLHEPSQQETAAMIADALGETEEPVRVQIFEVVRALGRTQSRQLLTETQEVEAAGGMMLRDGSRRRTPGGVFFQLVSTKGRPKPGKRLWRPTGPSRKSEKQEAKQEPQTEPAPVVVFLWQDRLAAIGEAEQEKGSANVKVTVIGRPGKIVDRGQCIVTVMESNKVPALPKGLPTPSAGATKYVVYIASKQWKKVAESIKDPEDVLIVEGFPTIDAETRSIAVFATNTTTKLLQKAQKEAQKAKGAEASA